MTPRHNYTKAIASIFYVPANKSHFLYINLIDANTQTHTHIYIYHMHIMYILFISKGWLLIIETSLNHEYLKLYTPNDLIMNDCDLICYTNRKALKIRIQYNFGSNLWWVIVQNITRGVTDEKSDGQNKKTKKKTISFWVGRRRRFKIITKILSNVILSDRLKKKPYFAHRHTYTYTPTTYCVYIQQINTAMGSELIRGTNSQLP